MHIPPLLLHLVLFELELIQLCQLVLDPEVATLLIFGLLVDDVHVLVFSVDFVDVLNVFHTLKVHLSVSFKFGNFLVPIFPSMADPRIEFHKLFLLDFLLG